MHCGPEPTGGLRVLLSWGQPGGEIQVDAMDRSVVVEEGRYRLLVEGITDYAIYMLDPSGIVTSWNAGAQRFMGYTAPEIIGQHFSRFYTDEDLSLIHI